MRSLGEKEKKEYIVSQKLFILIRLRTSWALKCKALTHYEGEKKKKLNPYSPFPSKNPVP